MNSLLPESAVRTGVLVLLLISALQFTLTKATMHIEIAKSLTEQLNLVAQWSEQFTEIQ